MAHTACKSCVRCRVHFQELILLHFKRLFVKLMLFKRATRQRTQLFQSKSCMKIKQSLSASKRMEDQFVDYVIIHVGYKNPSMYPTTV
jgi:hypothetical protein